jgi:lipopolysaccharide biosynthesis glycosyltransferase
MKVFVGWDSREDIAYQVCKSSIEETSSVPVEIIPLKQKSLRGDGVYTREIDQLASTEFTFTRFLIPHLCNYEGWALFIDCDFVFLEDIKLLWDQRDESKAVMCAHHDYTPKPGSTKMDGQVQHAYPRKNWSSMMLINCGHPGNAKLTLDVVNDMARTGAYFHRFSWLKDEEVGELSHEWNWLVGWYEEPVDGKPKALHYTEGGPWFDDYATCEYNIEWYRAHIQYAKKMEQSYQYKLYRERNKEIDVDDLSYTESKKKLIKQFLNNLIDPTQVYFKNETIENDDDMGIKTAAIAVQKEEFNLEKKGLEYDPYLKAFINGSGGFISDFDREQYTDNTLVIRGLGGGGQKAIKYCLENKRDFYAIDTGYIQPGTKKEYHRITKNSLQALNFKPMASDRLAKLNWKPGKPKTGSKILVVPPSEKVMKFYDQDLDAWMKLTIENIKKHTDRPIEVRLKPGRSERVTKNTIWDAMANDVYCLVTFNSIAASEAFLFGLPAIALAPNAASAFCNTSIADIENNLRIPHRSTQVELANFLSYNQFTQAEMKDGTAWRILTENYESS